MLIRKQALRCAAIGLLWAAAPRAAAQGEVPVLPPEDQRRVPTDRTDEKDINLGAEDADAARVADWVTQLGAAEYERREAASRALSELCPGAFRQLSETYRTVEDYETRLRIEEIVRTQYLWHTLLKRKGFLGVGLPPGSAESLPDGTFAVPISVSGGSAAEEAGLQTHDRIHAIDGQVFNDADAAIRFREWIQHKGAGSTVRLEVLRGGQVLQVEAILRARPLENYDQPELVDELNSRMQSYTLWWSEHFSLPDPHRERTPSTAVLELPE